MQPAESGRPFRSQARVSRLEVGRIEYQNGPRTVRRFQQELGMRRELARWDDERTVAVELDNGRASRKLGEGVRDRCKAVSGVPGLRTTTAFASGAIGLRTWNNQLGTNSRAGLLFKSVRSSAPAIGSADFRSAVEASFGSPATTGFC